MGSELCGPAPHAPSHPDCSRCADTHIKREAGSQFQEDQMHPVSQGEPHPSLTDPPFVFPPSGMRQMGISQRGAEFQPARGPTHLRGAWGQRARAGIRAGTDGHPEHPSHTPPPPPKRNRSPFKRKWRGRARLQRGHRPHRRGDRGMLRFLVPCIATPPTPPPARQSHQGLVLKGIGEGEGGGRHCSKTKGGDPCKNPNNSPS
ncbi:hypothetical protein SKAU_G00374630 [Synaphobranchus kaupii]|uniref:Uncharacterized protein n=1 Tax=Synaphobranchus kaupii TaxID=118154 RepID=A0A9Q1EGV6_SYNKA|nr:hypothetical protein SKAU_G00374630 [Synaphobranchus kaupii]